MHFRLFPEGVRLLLEVCVLCVLCVLCVATDVLLVCGRPHS
jgi:hypothetical protein